MKRSGFTLIELMVVIVLLGVFLAVAMPNMRSMYRSAKVSSTAYDLTTDVIYLRNLSILNDQIFYLNLIQPGEYEIGYPEPNDPKIAEELEEKYINEELFGVKELPTNFSFGQIAFQQPEDPFYYTFYDLPQQEEGDDEYKIYFFPDGTFYPGYMEIAIEKYDKKINFFFMGSTGNITSSIDTVESESSDYAKQERIFY